MAQFELYQPGFAVRIRPTATMASITSAAVGSAAGSGSLSGPFYYKVLACLESTGRFHGAPSPYATIAASSAKYVDLSWTSISGARSYKVYRATSSGGTYYLVGQTDAASFRDYATAPKAETLTYATNNTDPTVEANWITYDMRRDGGTFAHTKPSGNVPGAGFQECQLAPPSFTRQFPDGHSPASDDAQALDREFIRQESGLRFAMSALFTWHVGSDEDDALRTIFGGVLAHPELSEPGLHVEFTLDYANGAGAQWWKFELVGDWEPELADPPSYGRWRMEWTFVARRISNGVPLAGALTDLYAGKATWGVEA